MAPIPSNLTTVAKLIQLVNGEPLPSSLLPGGWVKDLVIDGVLTTISKGSRISYRAVDGSQLRNYLARRQPEFQNLEALHDRLSSSDKISRSEQVQTFGNSKHFGQSTVFGFFVNNYVPIDATLHSQPFDLNPMNGAILYITDIQDFIVPEDVVIVGVENMENLRLIKQQRSFFEKYVPNKRLLFLSRFPSPSASRIWLSSIPNQYVHFGDYDLSGVQIYLNYYKEIGNRASMLIPDNIESLLSSSMANRELYQKQVSATKNMVVSDPRIQFLVDLIHKYQRGFEQEGLISNCE